MDLQLIIDIIVAACTIVTLVIIYFTLREMKTQRHKLFEPHIFPSESKLFISCNNQLFGSLIKYGISVNENNIKESNDDAPYIKLINVGHGIAKDILISISFDFNHSEYFVFLKDSFEKLSPYIKINTNEKTCWIEERKDDELVFASSFPFETEISKKLDYLLPIKDTNEFQKINIPNSINTAISLTAILFNQRFDDRPSELFTKLQKELKIKLHLKYRDNLNKSYKESFLMTLDISDIRLDGKSGNMIYPVKVSREYKYFA